MLKKTITYEDLNGEKQVEEHYFHLSKSELVKMELGTRGGFGSYLQNMVKSDNAPEILAEFEKIVRASYGIRSLDGKKFDKDPKVTDEFMKSLAYDTMFMELVTSEAAVVEFILGIAPADIAESIDMTKIQVPGNQLLTPADQQKLFDSIQPMPPVGPDRVDVPPAFRRPPADQAKRMLDPGVITLPEALTNLSREELLAAYDRQMGAKGPDKPPPAA